MRAGKGEVFPAFVQINSSLGDYFIAAPTVSYISIAEDFCVHLIVPKADQIVPQGEADWVPEALD